MKSPNKNPQTKAGPKAHQSPEFDFFRRALESGAFDSLSDRAWVAKCEQIATAERASRHAPSRDGDPGSPKKNRGEQYGR